MQPVVGEIIGWEFLLVILVIALLFGSSQIPKLARSLGEASKEFKKGAEEGDSSVVQLRDVMTRFSMPFGFYPVESEAGRRLLDDAGIDASRLPVVIRYDGQVIVDPSLPDLARANRV